MTQLSDEVVERVAWSLDSAFNELSIGMPLTQEEAFKLARAAIAAYEAKGDIPVDEG